jgi:hypothetical protein
MIWDSYSNVNQDYSLQSWHKHHYTWPGSCRNCGGQSTNGTDFSLNISIFPSVSFHQPSTHIHSFIYNSKYTLQSAASLNKTHTSSSVSLPPHRPPFKPLYLTDHNCTLFPPWRSRQLASCYKNCSIDSGTSPKYSGTSVHERLSSRTNRFMNKFSEKKKSRVTTVSRVTNTQAGNNGWRQAGSISGRASVVV